MKPLRRSALALALSAPILGAPALGQANQDPNLDVRLSNLGPIQALGRIGTFPDGLNGAAMQTTVCNDGSVEVEWFRAMDPDHPVIAFLVARLGDQRIEQISDRSFLKHGFFAANTAGCGVACQQPGVGMIGEYLGIGCSDTYATTNNGDNYWLGPPDEVDPWLGIWDPVCSHFDRGEPAVAAPQDCNGLRSLSQTQAGALGPVGHRIHLGDADLSAGGTLYYQAQYVAAGEPEAVREDNLGSRLFTATWTGSSWSLNGTGPLLGGSVLRRWSGAELSSASNAPDDGLVYVAVKVTGPVAGLYHYEYALHNRDNRRGIGALRLPVCPGARVSGLGFRDHDLDGSNDWIASAVPGAVTFATLGAPLRWNSLYNFWFDSDAEPGAGSALLDQFDAGAGLATIAAAISTPTRLSNVHLGPGCALDTPPSLFAAGTPPRAELGNASFTLVSTGNAPLRANHLRFGLQPGTLVLHGCTLWVGAPGSTLLGSIVTSDAAGVATHPVPIPVDNALEGLDLRVQAVGNDPGNGVLFGSFELSEGLLVRVGSALSSCP